MATISPQAVRRALVLRHEIALIDLRHEAGSARGGSPLPRKDVPIVLHDDDEVVADAADASLRALS